MDIKKLFANFNENDFYSRVNLHIHSNYSDGSEDFDRLIERAKELKMKYVSITDHNCVLGYKNSKYKDDPLLIPGVEFDCIYKLSLLHILGYGIDVENKKINALCAKSEREQRNDLIRLFKSRHPKSVIEAIHDAGGIAVLAHPCCSNTFFLDGFVKSLKGLGLDGIEVYYPYNRFRGILKFASRKLPYRLAQKYNLIKTGGSDEHNSL